METKTLEERVLGELIALRGYGGIRESWMLSKAPSICQLKAVSAELRKAEGSREKVAYDTVCCAAQSGLVVERLETILRATLNVDGRSGDLDDRRWEVLAELKMTEYQYGNFVALEDRAYREFARRLVNLEASPCSSGAVSAAKLRAELAAEILAERERDRLDDLVTAYTRLFRLIGPRAAEEAQRLIEHFPRARASVASGPVGYVEQIHRLYRPRTIDMALVQRLVQGLARELLLDLVRDALPAAEHEENLERVISTLAFDLNDDLGIWQDEETFLQNYIKTLESPPGKAAILLFSASSAVLERRGLWELVLATESSPALFEMPEWPTSEPGEPAVADLPEDEDLHGGK